MGLIISAKPETMTDDYYPKVGDFFVEQETQDFLKVTKVTDTTVLAVSRTAKTLMEPIDEFIRLARATVENGNSFYRA